MRRGGACVLVLAIRGWNPPRASCPGVMLRTTPTFRTPQTQFERATLVLLWGRGDLARLFLSRKRRDSSVRKPGEVYSSRTGGLRSRFFMEWRRLEARIRSRTWRGMVVRIRGRRCPVSFSSLRRRLASAICLFRYWLRSCRQVTTVPVGRCRSRTAVSRRFTCCPPGPLDRNVSTSHSASNSSSDCGMRVTLTATPVMLIGFLPLLKNYRGIGSRRSTYS